MRIMNNCITNDLKTHNFKGRAKIMQKKSVVEKSILAFEKSLFANNLTETEQNLFSELKKLYGQTIYKFKNPNNIYQDLVLDANLSIEKLQNKNLIKDFINALKVMLNACCYSPTKINTKLNNYIVHNRNIANMIRDSYNKEELDIISTYLDKNKVFDLSDNSAYGFVINKENGLVEICGSTENYEMNQRCWITDIMRIGDIQKDKRPETWTKALSSIANYYYTQDNQFKKLIKHPELYRSDDISEGIPHIFIPKTYELDKEWFNNKRLESHGLALKEFSRAIIDGIYHKQNYGFDSVKNIPQNIFLALDNLTKLFKEIDYTTAPTSGNWEEICFKNGLTTDVEIIRSGLCAYKNLLYNSMYSSEKGICEVRNIIKKYNPLSEQELENIIQKGLQRVRRQYLKEAPNEREIDASLVFITTSDVKLSDSLAEDVKKNFEILNMLEKELVRKNGILRYKPFVFKMKDGHNYLTNDSYLGLNYSCAIDKTGKINLEWKTFIDKYGSKDASDPDIFYLRDQFSFPNTEAEWFMVSDMSVGYGKQIEKIIYNAKNNNRDLTKEEILLVNHAKLKQTEYFNRSIARITDENPQEIHQIKANGLEIPKVTLPEAYQYVTDLDNKKVCIPGINVPLAWALASLYNALKQQNKTLELLNI